MLITQGSLVRDQPDPPILLRTGAVEGPRVRQRGISSAGRAPALQAGGRRFDPVILHHYLDITYRLFWIHSKQKKLCMRVREAFFVLIDLDRLTSVERRTAVL